MVNEMDRSVILAVIGAVIIGLSGVVAALASVPR